MRSSRGQHTVTRGAPWRFDPAEVVRERKILIQQREEERQRDLEIAQLLRAHRLEAAGV
jgi:hypothetical protein